MPRLDMGDETLAVYGGADVTLYDLRSGLSAQRFGGFLVASIGSRNVVSFGKLDCNGTPDTSARSGDQSDRLTWRQVRSQWLWPLLRK